MSKVAEHFRDLFALTKGALAQLRASDPLILASSTAFFATFSLSPIVLLLVNIFGLYFKSDRLANQMFGKLGGTIGREAAGEIEKIVRNFMEFETTWWMTVGGIIFFLFVSTTLLSVVKINIHKLWRLRRNGATVRQQVRERSALAAIILVTGVFFFLSILLDTMLAISLDYLQSILPKAGIIVMQFLNLLFSVIIITLWFTILFKLLPDAKVEWDVAFNGGFVTALLYTAGKFALGKLLVHARLASIFGASASFAILLLFIFYCSFIVYFGAAFTYQFGIYSSQSICAGKHSHAYEERMIGTNES